MMSEKTLIMVRLAVVRSANEVLRRPGGEMPEKAILRTLLDVVLQYQQKQGADERTPTADLFSL